MAESQSNKKIEAGAREEAVKNPTPLQHAIDVVNSTHRMNKRRAKENAPADPLPLNHPLLRLVFIEVLMIKAGYTNGPSIAEMELEEYDERAYILANCMPIMELLSGGM